MLVESVCFQTGVSVSMLVAYRLVGWSQGCVHTTQINEILVI